MLWFGVLIIKVFLLPFSKVIFINHYFSIMHQAFEVIFSTVYLFQFFQYFWAAATNAFTSWKPTHTYILAYISMVFSRTDIIYSASTETSQNVLSYDLCWFSSCQILTGILYGFLSPLTATFANREPAFTVSEKWIYLCTLIWTDILLVFSLKHSF